MSDWFPPLSPPPPSPSEEEEEEELLESEEEEDGKPVSFVRSMLSARAARAGLYSWEEGGREGEGKRERRERRERERERESELKHLKHLILSLTHFQPFVPLLGELWSAAHSLVPDKGEVSDGAEVLRDGDGVVQVEHHVPPAPGHKHSLPGLLQDLQLQNTNSHTDG